MKKVKKIVALAMGTLMSVSLLAGCSTDGLALYNAFSKYKAARTMETKTDISFNVSADNLSKEEYKVLSVLPSINASKVSVSTKTKTNEGNTAAQVQSDLKMQFGAMPIDMSMWVDADFSNGKTKMKEIIRMPEIVTAQAPQFKGKEYMVMDLSDMMNTPGAVPIDYSKMAEIGKQFEPKLNQFIDTYVKQYNPKLNIINKLGRKDVQVFGSNQTVDVYELKLNDKSFKDLLKYTINNFGENKDNVINFLKDYLLTVNKIIEYTGQASQMTDKELNEVISAVSAAIPEAVSEFNKEFSKLENIKIFGDKGINIQYAVNNEGYIVNEKGSIQIVVDAASIMKFAKSMDNSNAASIPNYTGVYTITVDFNTDIRNINKELDIQFPVTNESNSVDYMELIMSGLNPDVNMDPAHKAAYEAIKSVNQAAKKYNVMPTFDEDLGNDTESVVKAVSEGFQSVLNEAKKNINNLPASAEDEKEAFLEMVDAYQNTIYERTSYLIANNKNNPKQKEIIWARTLIKDIDPAYKASYSTAIDALQQKIFMNAINLTDKAASSKVKEDLDKASQVIEELKNIPEVFSSENIANFIKSLEAKIK